MPGDEGLIRGPSRSVSRYAKFSQLFPSNLDKLTNSRIARLCVLFEDLRIEIAGMCLPVPSLENTGGLVARLDVAGYKYRELYFLRRSIATCCEFAEALRLLDESPGFERLLARVPPDEQNTWRDPVSYFRGREPFWRSIRNDVGGHFGSQAAEFAVESFLPGAGGSIEIRSSYVGKAGTVLGFASEIAATALLRHLPGNSTDEKVKALFEEVVTAYRHAVEAVECLVAHHLWISAGTG